MCSIIGVGERLHKVLGQIDLGTLDSGERSLPFELLVSLSADVDLNPGPADHPFGSCAIEILDDDAATVCDECGLWFHIQGQAISNDTYDNLVATGQPFSWICSNCDHPDFSVSAQSSFASYASPNNFNILTDEVTEITDPPSQVSTPGVAQHRPSPNKIDNLKMLNINCQSLVNKKPCSKPYLTYRNQTSFLTRSLGSLQITMAVNSFHSHLGALHLGRIGLRPQWGRCIYLN